MTTILWTAGAVWMAGGLLFCLALCKAASKVMPQPSPLTHDRSFQTVTWTVDRESAEHEQAVLVG